MSNLRKTIYIPLSTQSKSDEVIINVSWDILEKVERVFGTSAEYVATIILANIVHVQRHKIANLLQLWCQGKTELKPTEISEAVQTSSQQEFYSYVGKIQAAILWSIRGPDGLPLINDKQFDQLVNGEDIGQPEDKTTATSVSEQPKEKKQRAATSKKRTG